MTSNIKLRTWSQVRSPEKMENKIKEIFFLCSNRKEFLTEDERERFYQKWTKYYFTFWPDDFWLALTDNEEHCLGYLTGCRNSNAALGPFANGVPSFTAFTDQFDQYNCHLHINCHPDSQGMGVGSMLIENYIKILQADGAYSGIHVVTSPKSRNISFYEKNGFDYKLTRAWRGYELLFMGQKL